MNVTLTFSGRDCGISVTTCSCIFDGAAFPVCTSPQGCSGHFATYAWMYVAGTALTERLYLPFLEQQRRTAACCRLHAGGAQTYGFRHNRDVDHDDQTLS